MNVTRNALSILKSAAEPRNALAGYEAAPQTYSPPRNALSGLEGMTERDLLAAAIYSEGGNEPDIGQYGIGNVIMNRVNSGAYPSSIADVILQPGQFSAFNGVTGYAGGEGANDLWMRPDERSYQVADAILASLVPDYTDGALNYYNPDHADPVWGHEGFARIAPGSGHVFGTAG